MFLAGMSIARSVISSALSHGSQALGKASSALGAGAAKTSKAHVSPHKDGYEKPSSGAPTSYGRSSDSKPAQKADGAEGAGASASNPHAADGTDEKPQSSIGSKVMMGLGAAGGLVGLGGLFGGSSDSKES